VSVGAGIGPAGFIAAPGTATNAFGTFQLTAGNGITISTSVGQFQVASYNTSQVASYAPVQSVAGRVGNVVLQAADVTAGTFAIARIPTISYTALANLPATFGPSAHTHSTADVVSFTAAAAAAAPVQLVAGRTGAISLTVADVSGLAPVASSGSYTSLQNVPATFAPSAHTHGTADITGITSSFAAASHTHDATAIASGVLELARIPVIGYTALSGVPTTFSPVAHTHSTADITGITSSFAAAGHTHDAAAVASGVLELARIPTIGYTALSGVPTSFAPSVHTHSTADVVGLTASFSQLGHIHSTAEITGYSSLPAQAGKAGPLVTDGTAATWTTRYGVVDPVLVQGAGMTLTRDTSAGSITVAFAGGTSGIVVSSATPQPLGTASAGSSSDASRADHVHVMPSAADVGAAAAGHSHPYVQVLNGLTGTIAISGGAGVTVSTASSSITIAAAGSFELPTASSSVLGGIKVGTNLTITDGVLAATGGSGLTWSSVPASATATGVAGSIAYDSTGLYVCTATNTWAKTAVTTKWDSQFYRVPALLKFDGAGAAMVDSSSAGRAVAAFNNATQSTAQAKWGGSSLYLNGSASGSGTPNYVTFNNGADLDFGSGDFVIEFWMYASAQKFCPIVQHVNNTAGTGWLIWNYDTTDIQTVTRKIGINVAGKVGIFSSGDAYADNTWTHIAAVRSGNTLSLYSNGSRVATNSITGSITRPTSNTPKIGWLSASDWSAGIDAYFYNGYIDDLRITVGSDRGYTGTSFTTPSAAFPAY
jgi:hypothetical protein